MLFHELVDAHKFSCRPNLCQPISQRSSSSAFCSPDIVARLIHRRIRRTSSKPFASIPPWTQHGDRCGSSLPSIATVRISTSPISSLRYHNPVTILVASTTNFPRPPLPLSTLAHPRPPVLSTWTLTFEQRTASSDRLNKTMDSDRSIIVRFQTAVCICHLQAASSSTGAGNRSRSASRY